MSYRVLDCDRLRLLWYRCLPGSAIDGGAVVHAKLIDFLSSCLNIRGILKAIIFTLIMNPGHGRIEVIILISSDKNYNRVGSQIRGFLIKSGRILQGCKMAELT